MNLLMIAHSFPPVENSGTIRSAAFARYLPSYGVFPTVFTAEDAYDWGSRVGLEQRIDNNSSNRLPGVAVRSASWRLHNTEGSARSGIPLLRRLPGGATRDLRRRRQEFLNRVGPCAIAAAREANANVIYATAPPNDALLLAVHVGASLDLPVVADLRDAWSYLVSAPYRHWVDFLFERGLERRVLSACARIVVTTETYRSLLIRSQKLSAAKVVVIPNGFEEKDFQEAPNLEREDAGKIVIAHTGELSSGGTPQRTLKGWLKKTVGLDYHPLNVNHRARSPDFFLDAVEQLVAEDSRWRDALRIWFVGVKSRENYPAIASFPYPEMLRVQNRLAPSEAAAACLRADILMLSQNVYTLRSRDFCIATPAKLYTYLRSGARIVACVQPSEIADLIRALDAGSVAHPLIASEIAAALRRELAVVQSGRGARRVGMRDEIARYDRRRLAGNLADVLWQAADSEPRTRRGETRPITIAASCP